MLQHKDANMLLQAAQLAGLDKQLAAPASMFTLLAPTDDAFMAALPDLGDVSNPGRLVLPGYISPAVLINWKAHFPATT